ncbi:C25 family cysteine peptidase [Hymenobacter sp.]|uniref:putative type IX secretion system sortase PorU2 n=1 Tax=Hymenobacter sp. TaxID=1898978 RepID=UPI00286C4D3A|nr:C25 family cysteine peptidase [Hymenobacter sp.]
MNKNYTQTLRRGVRLLVLLGLLLNGSATWAQSGPVGNEWIVPGQQYYKVKILKDGLYKLDYQYLTQAGITGVVPNELQVWRRGREMARYIGGNAAVLDPTTFLEFYAVHNDGQLDAELYKRAVDQPHPYYSFDTDTASYFITWSAGRPGRAMSQPTAAAGTPHPHRLTSQLNLKVSVYVDIPVSQYNYLPWLESGEGYFEDGTRSVPCDSVIRNVALTGPPPELEVLMFGVSFGAHATEVLVVPPTGPARSLGVMRWTGRRRMRQTFQFLRSDVSSAGKVTIQTRRDASAVAGDNFYSCYFRVVAPQLSRWFANRRSVAFQNDSLLAGPATYEFEADSIPATAVGFDVQDLYNVQRVVGTAGSTNTRRRFVFPDANASATHRLLLADESHTVVPPMRAKRVYFRAINPAVPTFVIITNPLLMQRDLATGIANAPKEYASYRASTAGGRHDTLLVTVGQLYDQFFYGDRSWLAMRHFSRWLANATPTATNRFLLLLGKGIVPSEVGGRYRTGNLLLDLVPTSTRAVSDNMLTADFANDDFRARLNTGRLTVTTPAQILVYLAKLREHDLLRNDQVVPWRKNVLHLVGGEKNTEYVDFREYLNKYKQRVEQPLFGGKVVATLERSTEGLPVSVNIAQYLNPGLSLITFFGHGTPTNFSLDIGNVNDPSLGYNNPGKYPVLMFNNCAAASLFTSGTNLFFENWLFAPGKGAIGCMGQTGFGYEYALHPAQDSLFKLLFNDPRWYGRPITAVYNETVRRLQRAPSGQNNENNPFYYLNNDNIASEQLLCTTWHGDPTISLYAPPKPDFQVSNATLSISPAVGQSAVKASSGSFLLNIGVTNPGKLTRDTVDIRVTRIFDSNFPPTPPNSVTTYQRLQGPQGNATYAIELPNPAGANVFGNNTFRVELDYRNKVDESNETNNTAQTSFTFLRGGLTVLNPTEFAIVGTNRPRLVAQTNDPNGPQRVFEFEADTTAAFTSRLKQISGPVTATLTAGWQPTLPSSGRDSTVWYWRVRFQTQLSPDEDANWVVSSLRIIPGRTAGGWSQSHYAQFRRDQRAGVEVAAPTGRWNFSTENQPLLLRTRGGGVPAATPTFGGGVGFGITTNAAVPPTVADCAVNTPNLLVAVYDQYTLQPKKGLPAPALCGLSPQQFYIFGANPATATDTLNNLNNSTARQAQLAAFLAAVPEGDYVALVSMNRLRWPSLTNVRTAFNTLLGSQLVNQLQNGDPFALVAQKRSSGGRLIQEVGPVITAPATPRHAQTIVLSDTLRTPSSRGTITSMRIGPAQNWESLYHWIQREPGATSRFTLKVIGIDTLSNNTVLYAGIPPTSGRSGFSLATVSARQYPYLQLELTMADSLRRTAPQLREWYVTYRGVPEGVVRRDLVPASAYDPPQLVAQATGSGTINFPVKFENVTPFDFGTPLRAKVELRDAVAPFALNKSFFVTASRQLKGDSTLTIPVSIPMVGVFGAFTTKVTVNPLPSPLPEVNLFNNELTLAPFTVIDNNVPPTLDVAFDGRHILNGDIVSPVPIINIQLNDEDKLRPITDRTVFTVSLTRPGEPAPTLVNLNGPEVNFSVDASKGSVAKLEYRPGLSTPLKDGNYTLRVQGRDPSNASAGSQDFQVKFEVVSASKITNLYPYPNPVISKARFVFTVTGQELPRNMKIQIMSLTGRVVREIFMNELGPLHIGNNITDFAWDGTDTYGDRLANGTYLYRVSLDDPSAQFGRRATAGDTAFKNDWGKLVLMR